MKREKERDDRKGLIAGKRKITSRIPLLPSRMAGRFIFTALISQSRDQYLAKHKVQSVDIHRYQLRVCGRRTSYSAEWAGG